MANKYQNENTSDYLISISNIFFQSLAAELNLYNNEEDQMELTYYIPALIVTYTDGFYVNYLAEAEDGGNGAILERIWTECQPYMYNEGKFIYRFFLDDRILIYDTELGDIIEGTMDEIMNDPKTKADLTSEESGGKVFVSKESYYEYKKEAITSSVLKVLERTVNEHGKIAGQRNINIIYETPDFLSNFTPAQTYPSFFAIFQGYPLTADGKVIYNNTSSSAAYMEESSKYIVEVSNSPIQPFSVYHKEGCSYIGYYGTVLPDKCSGDEAILKYGCYTCPHCFIEEKNVEKLP